MSMILATLFLSLLRDVRALYFNQMISTSNTLYCPTGSSAHGWIFYSSQEEVEVTPDPLQLKVSAVEVTLKFCEAHESLMSRMPRGDYCLFKGRSNCPERFTEHAFNVKTGKYDKSTSFGSTNLCCSTFLSDPVTMPFPAPFVLIRKTNKCQEVANTKVTEVTVRTVQTETEILHLCYYEESPCAVKKGGCEQVCSFEDDAVQCSCYPGYHLDGGSGATRCIRSTTLTAVVSEETTVTDPDEEDEEAALLKSHDLESATLFSTNREIVAMATGGAVVMGTLLLLFALLIYCRAITCTSACRKGYLGLEKRAIITTANIRKPSAAAPGALASRRISAVSVNRNSISGPLLNTNVAVDLLNRPKPQMTPMHDVASNASLRPSSYYANQDRHSVHSGVSNRESIYDSLDRRRRNQVAVIQYAEPNMGRSTATITNDDLYYCQPDETLMNQIEPETPLPVYAQPEPDTPVPVYAQPEPETPVPGYDNSEPETPVPIYHNTEIQQQGFAFPEYQDPATKFSHGTLGRRWTDTSSSSDRSGTASVARIAPMVRVPSGNISFNNILK